MALALNVAFAAPLRQAKKLYPKNGSWNAEKPFVLSNVEACPE